MIILENRDLNNKIKKTLKKRLQLQPGDVKRIAISWFGESLTRPGKSNEYLQVHVEIKPNAFFIGRLGRGYPDDLDDRFYQGFFWIGRTRYEIWRD